MGYDHEVDRLRELKATLELLNRRAKENLRSVREIAQELELPPMKEQEQ